MRKPALFFAALIVTLVATTLVLTDAAEARRMGGGRSFGTQRESITPSRSTPAPSSPAGNATSQSSPAAAVAPKAAPPVAAPSGMSRWLGPIAGIAAGLGLAALMSHLGMSEGFGSILLIGLAIFAGIYLLRMLMGRRSNAGPTLSPAGVPAAAAGGLTPRYDGAPVNYEAIPGQATREATSTQWSSSPVPTAEPSSVAGSPSFGVDRKPLPPGFDAVSFANEAKRQYIEVQRFYDSGDRTALSNVMTAEMARDVRRDLDERGTHHATEIVTLQADVLDAATEGDKYWVSVRFTGLVREDGEPVAKSIDEVWNLSKPVKGTSGWLLAGISQLA